MRNIIVGTAGHIDHGKTALIGALTGTDTDRLAEEKRRGISIDLGFAFLQFAGGLQIGFVDVPGHERFVKNMLAGAGGIDMVLFVIAADESIKPQTREHFEICRLLGIPRGIIALTKSDLVDKDILELVRLEAEEFVKGSFLENAPIIAVSSKTGDGMEQLRGYLADAASQVSAKDISRHFRLPVDRAFSMRGFGSVVTGTLVSGSVKAGQEVEAHPAGVRLRVRGIQVHGLDTPEAFAGQRTALNLAGPDTASIARGMILTQPDLFQPTKIVDATLDLLPSAKPLKHASPVHFHCGTAEIVAEARLLESSAPLRPGAKAFVRFLLSAPALLLPGDRFIIRMFSPVTTIGGGIVLEIAPPPRMRRAITVKRLKVLSEGPAEERLALVVSESLYGLGQEDLIARIGLLASEVEACAQSSRFVALMAPQLWLAGREEFEAMINRIASHLRAFHKENPLLPGMSKEELRTRELPEAPSFLLDALLAKTENIVAEGETVRLASHKLSLDSEDEKVLEQIESSFEKAGLAAPSTQDVLAASGAGTARARSLLQILIRRKRLVRVRDELIFHISAIQSLRSMLAQRKGQHFSIPQFKDWTGISRKYAIPLLEYLDSERLTRREGDARIIL